MAEWFRKTWFDLHDPNRRAHMNRLRISDERHYTFVRGYENEHPVSFLLRIPTADIEAFALALRKHAAGELGALAIEHDEIETKKACAELLLRGANAKE